MKPRYNYDRHTNIVCTLGPATNSIEAMETLLGAGMDIARLNLSHGTLEEHADFVRSIREAARRLNRRPAIVMDLPGPKFRIGKLAGDWVELKQDDLVTLTSRQVAGTEALLPVNLPNLASDVNPGDTVLLADGAMRLEVVGVQGSDVVSRVVIGGRLTEGRGLVVPGMQISSPYLNPALEDILRFAAGEMPEYLALSFVTEAQDVSDVRSFLQANGSDIPLISKIERGAAVDNLESILEVSDGIMVARGDLGVEIPLEQVPMIQKDIIRKCNEAGKPVITATEMLESMIHEFRPTRAEVTDVANAIFDGTDATMLSAETSIGKYPVEAVKIMARIAKEAEARLPYKDILLRGLWQEVTTAELISHNACYTAYTLGAKAIVALTQSGSTAARVSKHRPPVPVIAMTPGEIVSGRLLLYWGVYPFETDHIHSLTDLFSTAARLCRDQGLAKPGDIIIITGGIPLQETGHTNLLKVEVVC